MFRGVKVCSKVYRCVHLQVCRCVQRYTSVYTRSEVCRYVVCSKMYRCVHVFGYVHVCNMFKGVTVFKHVQMCMCF